MIQSIRHKGLRRLHEADDRRGVNPDQADRLRRMLARLDASSTPADMDMPGFRLHSLKGRLAGFHAVTVSGNWRVIFRFVDGNAVDVDYVDYH